MFHQLGKNTQHGVLVRPSKSESRRRTHTRQVTLRLLHSDLDGELLGFGALRVVLSFTGNVFIHPEKPLESTFNTSFRRKRNEVLETSSFHSAVLLGPYPAFALMRAPFLGLVTIFALPLRLSIFFKNTWGMLFQVSLCLPSRF